MGGIIVLGVVVMMVGVVLAGLTLLTQTLSAAERISPTEKERTKENKKDGICVDVVIEEVDFSTNTITARSTVYIIPPHDNVGGAVFKTGTTDSHQDKATKYVRLPVMPQAKLTEKKPKAGQHAILRLELLQQGLVVVGIEAFTGLERIGVDWPDAPRTKRRLRSRLPCRFIRSDEIRMSSCPQPLSATERIPIGRNVQYENSHVDLLLLLANRNSDNREIAVLSSAPSMGIPMDPFTGIPVIGW